MLGTAWVGVSRCQVMGYFGECTLGQGCAMHTAVGQAGSLLRSCFEAFKTHAPNRPCSGSGLPGELCSGKCWGKSTSS